MRGISSDYGRGKVLIIVDGMRQNPVQGRVAVNWDAINLSEVERIEVLDGGASVQYGDNASVGVINIITKKSGAAKTDITVSGGSFFQNEQRFSHQRPTGWGSFTISGGHRGTQGYQNHTANDAGNGELRGVFDINDTMSLQANVGFTAGNGLIANGLTKSEFDDDSTQNKGPSSSSFSRTGVNAGMGFTWAINDTLNFDLPVSYNFIHYKSYIPSSMIYDLAPHMLGIRPKITAELKPADMILRLTGGVDTLFAFSDVKTSYDLVRETNPTIQTLSEFTIGPWALANFEPFPLLSLNMGLRYDAAFIKAHMDAWSGTVGANPVSYAAGDESAQWDAFVYEAGLTVNPLDFLKVYAKYGTQFRYPYLDDLIAMPYASGGTIGLNTGIEPEKGWTVEGGIGVNIKSIVKLDANFYYLRIDNEILSIITSNTLVTMNLDPIDRLGANIGVNLTPFKKYIDLDIDYGFVNAEFSEGAFEGKFVPLVAAHTLSGSLILNLPFGLSFGPDVLYKSEIYQGLDNNNDLPTVDPSFIWGALVRYTPKQFDGNLTVQLTAHNLADVKYASMVYAMPAIYGGTTYYVDPNMGRSINVSLQYRF
jgi:iron complex outermembrane receptor protein